MKHLENEKKLGVKILNGQINLGDSNAFHILKLKTLYLCAALQFCFFGRSPNNGFCF